MLRLMVVGVLQVYATMPDQLRQEQADPDKVAEHIKDLAHQLYLSVSLFVCFRSVFLLKLCDVFW